MENLFYLQQLPTLQTLSIAYLYLEYDQFGWYQWLCDHKKDSIVSLFVFVDELEMHYRYSLRNIIFIQLRNIRKRGIGKKNIQQFQKLIP